MGHHARIELRRRVVSRARARGVAWTPSQGPPDDRSGWEDVAVTPPFCSYRI